MTEAQQMLTAIAVGAPLMVLCAIPVLHEGVLQFIEERRRPPSHNCQCRRRT